MTTKAWLTDGDLFFFVTLARPNPPKMHPISPDGVAQPAHRLQKEISRMKAAVFDSVVHPCFLLSADAKLYWPNK